MSHLRSSSPTRRPPTHIVNEASIAVKNDSYGTLFTRRNGGIAVVFIAIFITVVMQVLGLSMADAKQLALDVLTDSVLFQYLHPSIQNYIKPPPPPSFVNQVMTIANISASMNVILIGILTFITKELNVQTSKYTDIMNKLSDMRHKLARGRKQRLSPPNGFMDGISGVSGELWAYKTQEN